MSNHQSKHEDLILELHDLILARINEDITREQVDRLEFLIINDPDARQIYTEYMLDTVSLRWWAKGAEGLDEETSREMIALRESLLAVRLDENQFESIRPKFTTKLEEFSINEESGDFSAIESKTNEINYKPTKWYFTWSIAAGILLLLGVLGIVLKSILGDGKSGNMSGPIATMVSSSRSTWKNAEGEIVKLTPGSTLSAGPLILDKGLAKLQFSSGVIAILDSRVSYTELNLKSNQQVYLKQGRMNILNKVGNNAKSFFVDLSGNRQVIDIGTEFGLIVDQSKDTEVYCFEGIVDYKQYNDKGDLIQQRRLIEDEQVLAREKGDLIEIDGITTADFVRANDYAKIAESLSRQTKEGFLAVESYRFPNEDGKAPLWYRKSYPDSGYELIDGHVGEAKFQDSAWVGWADGRIRGEPDTKKPQPRIDFELSEEEVIGTIEIVYLQTIKGAVYAPDKLIVTVSRDKDFKDVISQVTHTDFATTQQGVGVFTTRVNTNNIKGKYIRFDFYNDENWTFLGEVRFLPPVVRKIDN